MSPYKLAQRGVLLTLFVILSMGSSCPSSVPVVVPPISDEFRRALISIDREKQLMERWHCASKTSPVAVEASSAYLASRGAASQWLDRSSRIIADAIPLTSFEEGSLRDPLLAEGRKLGKARLAFLEVMLKSISEVSSSTCGELPDISKFQCSGPDILSCIGAQEGPFASVAVAMLNEALAVGDNDKLQRAVLAQLREAIGSQLW